MIDNQSNYKMGFAVSLYANTVGSNEASLQSSGGTRVTAQQNGTSLWNLTWDGYGNKPNQRTNTNHGDQAKNL